MLFFIYRYGCAIGNVPNRVHDIPIGLIELLDIATAGIKFKIEFKIQKIQN